MMNWDTLQWILGLAFLVAFPLLMLRCCSGTMGGMGGCGIGPSGRRRHRHGGDAEHHEHSRRERAAG